MSELLKIYNILSRQEDDRAARHYRRIAYILAQSDTPVDAAADMIRMTFASLATMEKDYLKGLEAGRSVVVEQQTMEVLLIKLGAYVWFRYRLKEK